MFLVWLNPLFWIWPWHLLLIRSCCSVDALLLFLPWGRNIRHSSTRMEQCLARHSVFCIGLLWLVLSTQWNWRLRWSSSAWTMQQVKGACMKRWVEQSSIEILTAPGKRAILGKWIKSNQSLDLDLFPESHSLINVAK
jgi:hypothetical protein